MAPLTCSTTAAAADSCRGGGKCDSEESRQEAAGSSSCCGGKGGGPPGPIPAWPAALLPGRPCYRQAPRPRPPAAGCPSGRATRQHPTCFRHDCLTTTVTKLMFGARQSNACVTQVQLASSSLCRTCHQGPARQVEKSSCGPCWAIPETQPIRAAVAQTELKPQLTVWARMQ
jgi:hypothetical protein